MTLMNITEGRQRAIEALNRLEPDDGEILYGERNGGIGYCPFQYTKNGKNYVATVRTANRDFVKIDPRMLETNIAAAEDRELEHVLIVGFNWLTHKRVYLIHNCQKYIHHQTKGWKYQVFKWQHIAYLARRSNYVGDIELL